jgi:hypothetical protein
MAGTLPSLRMFDQIPSESLPFYRRLFITKLITTIVRGIESVVIPDLVTASPRTDGVPLAKHLQRVTTERMVSPVIRVVITVFYDHELSTDDVVCDFPSCFVQSRRMLFPG